MRENIKGFVLESRNIKNNILIPKYYNPILEREVEEIGDSHDIYVLGDLISENHVDVTTGDEIGKMAYGTGNIPFVRTSDITNWEIKTDPKQGVDKAIFQQYATKQDVKAGDIFLVRDGTYLIGNAAIITQDDLPLLYQSHILKFRMNESCPITPALMLTALSSPIAQKQLRSVQFTADIIDTIGNRYRDIKLAFPKSPRMKRKVEENVKDLLNRRNRYRQVLRNLPNKSQGLETISLRDGSNSIQYDRHLLGFRMSRGKLRNNILLARYYNPGIDKDMRKLSRTHDLIPLQDLVDTGLISWSTGVEPGKMAYETGNIPFIRTSDITNWELKGNPKHCVSEVIYREYAPRTDVKELDILLVRDGTYLIGTSCIITEKDTKILFAGGMYKFRVERPKDLDPYLFLVLLNSPIVRRQIKACQFTRDIIDTIGKRVFNVRIPIPKDSGLAGNIARKAKEAIIERVNLRVRALEISRTIGDA